jgi:hypothetical protein
VIIIKAKYYVIELHYMEGTTPDQLASNVVEPYCLKVNPTNDITIRIYYEDIARLLILNYYMTIYSPQTKSFYHTRTKYSSEQ